MTRFWTGLIVLALGVSGLPAQLRNPFLDDRYVDSEQVFDTSLLARIDLTMTEADYQASLADPAARVEYPGTMRFQNALLDETLNGVGLRFRGGTSIFLYKHSWNIDFNEFSIDPDQRFHGLRQFNVNSHHNDPSIFRGHLMLDFCRSQGIPAPRSHLTDLYLHTTGPGAVAERFLGTFVNVEQIDKTFLRAWFTTASGTLWKCNWPADFQIIGSGASTEYEFSQYEMETNEAQNDWSPLADFIQDLNTISGGQFEADFPDHLDVDSYLRELAVETLFGHWDNHWRNTNNCWIYWIPDTGQPGTGVMQFITYDTDNTMGVNFFYPDPDSVHVHADDFGDGGGDPPLPTRVLGVPAWRSQYHQVLADWYAGPFTSAAMDPEVARYRDMISPSILADIADLNYYGNQWGYTHTDFLNSVNLWGSLNFFTRCGVFEYIARRSAQGVPAELAIFETD
jgi:spore coat protein CotH